MKKVEPEIALNVLDDFDVSKIQVVSVREKVL